MDEGKANGTLWMREAIHGAVGAATWARASEEAGLVLGSRQGLGDSWRHYLPTQVPT
jgi:hypothetical protein